MFSLFQRAWQRLNLSPAERTFLKVFWLLIRQAGGTALYTIIQYAGTHQVKATDVYFGILFSVFVEVLGQGIGKYIGATFDLPLGSSIQNVSQAAANKLATQNGVTDTITVMPGMTITPQVQPDPTPAAPPAAAVSS